MPQQIKILTPENVELSYELAGLGSRFLAAITDVLIQILSLLVLVLGFAAAAGGLSSLNVNLSGVGTWAIAALIIVAFVIVWGYYVFFETRWNGQTPGKRSLGIRVIRDGGYPIDFRAAAIRNLVRYADLLPGMYGLGIISIFLSSQCKRLGDYAAGTIVIKERGKEDALPLARTIATTDIISPRLLDDAMIVSLSRLTSEDYRLVRHFLDRRGELALSVSLDFARRISINILQKLGSDPSRLPADPVPFLEEIASAYESRHRL